MSKGDKNKGYIYALTLDGIVMYVGQTYNLTKRYNQHCSLAQNGKTTKRNVWLKELLLSGRKPEMEVLEKTHDMDEAEIRWIKKYREGNPNLLNMADGGQTMSHLTRAKKSRPWGNTHSPVQKILMSFKQDERMFTRLGKLEETERSRQRYKKSLINIELVGRDVMNYLLWEKHNVR